MRRSVVLPFLAALLLSGCASAPIQEMSDARQAISAARQVVGADATPTSVDNVRRAEGLLQAAESELRAGNYSRAREHAREAKLLAIEARERAAGDVTN